MTKEDAFLLAHNQPDFVTGAFAIAIIIGAVCAYFAIGIIVVEKIIQPYLDRRDAKRRLPRAERRPDAMEKEMQEQYDEACRRG